MTTYTYTMGCDDKHGEWGMVITNGAVARHVHLRNVKPDDAAKAKRLASKLIADLGLPRPQGWKLRGHGYTATAVVR